MGQIENEQGSALVEVLVSSILLVIAAVGVFNAFDAGTRSTAEQRHRVQAHGLAQADLARMRTMRISDLSNLDQSKVVTIDRTAYTIESDAEFQTDKAGTASCEEGEASADYIQIRSTVTWPSIGTREPVVAQSLVAPPNGSISTKRGSLAVQIVDAEDVGIEGVGLAGTGAGSFSGSTGPTGCAIFGNLPAGAYTLNVTSGSLVDHDGNPPQAQSTSVVAESTNTLVLQFDQPGEIEVGFETWVGGVLVPSSADSVVAFNSGMTLAKSFGTPGVAEPTVAATSLFPFTSPYSVYAGACGGNDPNQFGEAVAPEAIGEAVVEPGGSAPVTIQLPPLNLTAWSGASAEDPESLPVEGAEVKVVDTKCTLEEEEPLVRAFTTDGEGGLADPGLPFSTYDVCVGGGGKHVSVSGLDLPADPEDLKAGAELDVFLGNPAAETGPCP